MNPQNSPTSSLSAGGTGMDTGDTQASGTLAETKQKITQAARNTASKVKAAASDTVAKARGEAERIASEKKESAAGHIGNYSSALHESAKSLEEKDPNIAWFTHQAADKLQSVADYMRQSDFECLRGDCEGLARRHPAAFFGGLFFTGLLLGNMLKASSRHARDDQPEFDHERSSETSGDGDGGFPTQAQLSAAERDAAGL